MEAQTTIAAMQILSTTVISCFGLWILAWYRINRKWVKAEPKTWKQWFVQHWVEIVITVVVVPQWPELIRAAIKLITQGG